MHAFKCVDCQTLVMVLKGTRKPICPVCLQSLFETTWAGLTGHIEHFGGITPTAAPGGARNP